MEVLVQSQGKNPKDAMWVPFWAFEECYLDFNLEDKVGPSGEGCCGLALHKHDHSYMGAIWYRRVTHEEWVVVLESRGK